MIIATVDSLDIVFLISVALILVVFAVAAVSDKIKKRRRRK